MKSPRQDTLPRDRFVAVAIVLSLLVGLGGLYPHLKWSWEMHQVAWFFNSYDEGYYGWDALGVAAPNRWISSLVMKTLFHLTGADTQLMMIGADFFLPLSVTLAACYLVRPLCGSATGMAGAALLVLVSAECLALRSSLIPYAELHPWLQSVFLSWGSEPSGVFQIDNRTSTFWLFRTPEPQVSWIGMFAAMGWALRWTALARLSPTTMSA